MAAQLPSPIQSRLRIAPMAARLIAGPAPGLPHHLDLGEGQIAPEALTAVADTLEGHRLGGGFGMLHGPVVLACRERRLNLPELRAIRDLLAEHRLQLVEVRSSAPETLVAASAMGLVCSGLPEAPEVSAAGQDPPANNELTVLRRTLRSGDQVRCQGSVLVLGDVNPGAQVIATGHVLVWGRLRGVAHAGADGDRRARIIALQLRPVQLRIADAVARGPDGAAPLGLAEQAVLTGRDIRIEPASALWPLAN